MLRLPRDKSLGKLKDRVREKTKRISGDSLEFIIKALNSTLRGWFAYFRHCCPPVYYNLDGWIRRRLRSLLRKRAGRSGISWGALDNQQWPNDFFADQGLLSLETTHGRLCQSSCR